MRLVMIVTKYHGKYVEGAIYVAINAVMPLISKALFSFDFSMRFYLGISLFVVITAMNFCRTFAGGYVRLVYWVTILLNLTSFILLGMVSYIYAARMLLYLF